MGSGLVLILAVACFGLGFLSAFNADAETRVYHVGRFQSDSAVGATANAVEELAERADDLHAGVAWAACGLLLILIAQLVRVQDYLRHLMAMREQELYGE